MNKIDKFRGLLEVEVKGDVFLLNSLKVNDLFDLLLLSKKEENSFEFGVKILYNIFSRTYPNEVGLEGFIISNYIDLLDGIMISLGWITKEKLNELRRQKDNKVDKKKNVALFKAKLNAEVNAEEIEDKYITTCYVLMREFKYTKEYILDMDANVFLILIDEMNKQNEKEKAEMNKNKTMRKH